MKTLPFRSKSVGILCPIGCENLHKNHFNEHFFSDQAKKFFRSQVISARIIGERVDEKFDDASEVRVIFVTSEIDPNGKKAFTVRMYSFAVNEKKKGIVDLVPFHSIPTRSEALKVMAKFVDDYAK